MVARAQLRAIEAARPAGGDAPYVEASALAPHLAGLKEALSESNFWRMRTDHDDGRTSRYLLGEAGLERYVQQMERG
jgi:beta-phosphoglucomutase-like phosphatase (HAD superfamily)